MVFFCIFCSFQRAYLDDFNQLITIFVIGRWNARRSSDVGRRDTRHGSDHSVYLRMEIGHRAGIRRPLDHRRRIPTANGSQKTPAERCEIYGRSGPGKKNVVTINTPPKRNRRVALRK